MTKEEREKAIDLLDNLLGMVEDNQDNDYDKALKMGIESLRKEPCADAISRKAVLDMATTIQTDDYSGNETLEVVLVEEILGLTPADVVEREKIDKAIEEMERYSTFFEYANRSDLASAVDRCIGMIQKNIGERTNESID